MTEEKRASNNKKISKHIIEKRRRARINRSLEELRKLVLQTPQHEATRTTKLEKADILEIAVDNIRNMMNTCRSLRFEQGYRACLQNVSEFFEKSSSYHGAISASSQLDLLQHLNGQFAQIASKRSEVYEDQSNDWVKTGENICRFVDVTKTRAQQCYLEELLEQSRGITLSALRTQLNLTASSKIDEIGGSCCFSPQSPRTEYSRTIEDQHTGEMKPVDLRVMDTAVYDNPSSPSCQQSFSSSINNNSSSPVDEHHLHQQPLNLASYGVQDYYEDDHWRPW